MNNPTKYVLEEIENSARRNLEAARNLLLGARVRVLSDYNGQPYGRTKPSQKGKVFKVTGVWIDGAKIVLGIEGFMLCIGLGEVELLDE